MNIQVWKCRCTCRIRLNVLKSSFSLLSKASISLGASLYPSFGPFLVGTCRRMRTACPSSFQLLPVNHWIWRWFSDLIDIFRLLLQNPSQPFAVFYFLRIHVSLEWWECYRGCNMNSIMTCLYLLFIALVGNKRVHFYLIKLHLHTQNSYSE